MKIPANVSTKIKETKLKTIFYYFVLIVTVLAIYQIGFQNGDAKMDQVMRDSRPKLCGSSYASGFEGGCEVDRPLSGDDTLGSGDEEQPEQELEAATPVTEVDKWLQKQKEEAELIQEGEELSDEDWGKFVAEWSKQPPDSSKKVEDGSSKGVLEASKDVLGGWFGKSKPSGVGKAKAKSNSSSGVVEFGTKVAVMLETRMLDRIPPMIQHFSSVLGPTWPIIIYTAVESYRSYTNSSSKAFNRLVSSGRINIKKLPAGTEFPDLDKYSKFMTEHWLWEQLAPAENILIFQGDSMLCANAPMTVDDFLEYDFIGAPITPALGIGFNGGFSLRKRSSTLRVLNTFNWTESPDFEDRWYHARLNDLKLADQVNAKNTTIKIPTYEEAMKFAVESMDYPTPVGVHQARRYPKDEKIALEVYCPEFKLCTGPWAV